MLESLGKCSRHKRRRQIAIEGKAWKLTEDSEEDVDEEISTAATLEEDTQRGEDDGKDDLADIAV